MKRTIVTWNTYQMGLSNPVGESFEGHTSLTVPDMALSLRDLVDRYIRKQEVDVFNVTYSDEPEFEKMDAIDRIEAARQVKEQINIAQQTNMNLSKMKAEKVAADLAAAKPSVPPPDPVLEVPGGSTP